MSKPKHGRFEQCQVLFQDRGLSLTRCNMHDIDNACDIATLAGVKRGKRKR
jgi:hypothetical protein